MLILLLVELKWMRRQEGRCPEQVFGWSLQRLRGALGDTGWLLPTLREARSLR